MGKVTKSIPHLSKEEIQERIKATVGFWRVQKWLVIWNALVDPRPAREIALHTGLAEQSVHNLISRYNRLGPEVGGGAGEGWKAPLLFELGRRGFVFRIIQTGGSYRSDRYGCRDQGGAWKAVSATKSIRPWSISCLNDMAGGNLCPGRSTSMPIRQEQEAFKKTS